MAQLPRVPSPEELSRLQRLCSESGRTSSVQLGRAFARRPDYTSPDAPLATLFRRGEVPLKVYLTLVMLTRKAPHALFRDTSPEGFALALGLERPEHITGAGTRRVTRALATLEREALIVRTRRRGRFPLITVHHENEKEIRPPYITLPLDLWRNGWLNAMPGAALATYVALRLEEAGRPGEVFHIRPFDRELYGLSDESWRRGTAQLVALGLLDVKTGKPEDRALLRRERNLYRLIADVMQNRRPGENP